MDIVQLPKNIKLFVQVFFCLLTVPVIIHAEDSFEKQTDFFFRLTDDNRVKTVWAKTVSFDGTVPVCITLQSENRYDAKTGYGYDLLPSPQKGKTAPYFFSVNVPDGNYRVTLTLGSRNEAGCTTVRAESRRLFVERLSTRKGEFATVSFVVNKRNIHISDAEEVHIKQRERTKLNWDDKLTLEFNGPSPQCVAIQIERDETVPTVFLAGNSTVVDQDEEPWASWGQMIPRFFDDRICFANYAESGESANTFIAAGRLKKALTQMKPGDYLFMEFGHNDQKQKGPGKGAYYSFATSLKCFIDEARQRGVTPVLVTPTRRRAFKNGKIQNTHEDYPEAIHWLAEREHVAVIDLQEMTRVLFETMGEKNSRQAFVHYPSGTFPGQTKAFADNTHFNPYGAYEIAKCVIEGIRQVNLPMIDYLRTDYVLFDPERPDSLSSFQWDQSPFITLEKPDGN